MSNKHGNTLDIKGPVLYSGSRDQLNQLCREYANYHRVWVDIWGKN